MTIQDEMHKRFNDILRQYDNEVRLLLYLFVSSQRSIPSFVDHWNQQYLPTQQSQTTGEQESAALFRCCGLESIVIPTNQTHNASFTHQRSADADWTGQTGEAKHSTKIDHNTLLPAGLDQELLSSCRSRDEGIRRCQISGMETAYGTDPSDSSETKRSQRTATYRE